MTAYDYSRIRATAQRLIARFGRPGTLRRVTLSSGFNPTSTAADYQCTVVFEEYRASEIDGTLIQRGDRRALVAAQGLTIRPSPADDLVVDLVPYAIVRVEATEPGPVPVMFALQVRA